MKQTSLYITGVGGMVGSHMVDMLSAIGQDDIVGTYFKPTTDIRDISVKANLIECDVRYAAHVERLIMKFKPQVIMHLAAQSYPTVSWDRPSETIEINITGTANIFEAIKTVRLQHPEYDPMVVVACSSAEYGSSLTPENTPITEEAALLPLHPYGVSKVGQDLLAYQYHYNDKIRCIRARIFNTTGPRKQNDVLSDFTQRAVRISQGKLDSMRVGNLDSIRAITDVRDLVAALLLLAEKGTPGEVYNICGSKTYRIGDLIPILEEEVGVKIPTHVDPSLLRPSDEPIIFGDVSRLKDATNWTQQYDIRTTIKDMIQYWRTHPHLVRDI